MATPPRLYFGSNHQDSGGHNFLSGSGNRQPCSAHAHQVDSARIALTPREAAAALRSGKPSIVLASGEHGEVLSMNSFMLQPGEEKIIAQELGKVLKSHAA